MSVSKLSEVLTTNGAIIQVFTTTANGPDELAESGKSPVNVNGVPVRYFKRITKDHSHFSPALLSAVWRNCKQFDVVHIHAWWNTVSVLSCLIAHLRGVKVVVSPRGTLSPYSFHNKNAFIKKLIHNLLSKPLLNRSAIHVTSGHEGAAMAQLISAKQIFDIPNFVNFPTVTPTKKQDADGKLKLIFLSRIEQKKGLDLLIEALAGVTIAYSLTIAGSGDPEYINTLKSLAEKYSVSDNITWAGFQSDNKFDLLAAHHLLVLPSFDENFGNVVIESLSVGTPVLLSGQVGLAAYVQNNKLGWICNTKAASIAGTINGIDRQTLQEISLKAPAIIQQDFAEEQLIKQYLDMYKQVTKNGRL